MRDGRKDEAAGGERAQERLDALLRELAAPPPDPDFRARLRADFAGGAIAGRPGAGWSGADDVGARRRRGPPWWVWVAVPAAAAAVLVLLLLSGGQAWQVERVDGSGVLLVDGRAVPAESDALQPLLVGGAELRIPQGVILDLALPGVLSLQLDWGAELSLPPAPGPLRHRLECELRSGELRLATGPRFPGERLLVRTPEGLTEVTGTIVSVYRGDGFTCVCVLEGTAEVGSSDDSMEPVAAGRRKVMFADGRPPLRSEIEPEHERGLQLFRRQRQGTRTPGGG